MADRIDVREREHQRHVDADPFADERADRLDTGFGRRDVINTLGRSTAPRRRRAATTVAAWSLANSGETSRLT